MEESPIFIGGLDRCGKTLLRALLVSHPHIAIPAIGSNYWTFFYRQYGDLRRPENFERCLADMLHYTHVSLLNPDANRIRREFWQSEPTYSRLFALFNQQYAGREGKPRWGDQTGLIERYADAIYAAYPGAKILHMIRDPRDRYEASLALHPKGKGRVGGATARWLYSTGLARRNLKRYPGRYMVVQYERLVRSPEATMQEICEFLNEDYTPSLLTMDGAPEFREKIQQGKYGKDRSALISQEFIGRYRNSVRTDEIAFMQSLAGREMLAQGYPLELVRLAALERLRFYTVGWPINLIRMLSWFAVEMLQQSFPSRFRRRLPPSKMRQGRRQMREGGASHG
jgi:hypothetical protein